MKILALDAYDDRLIDRFDSQGARHVGIAEFDGGGGVSIIRLDANGVLGRHPAVVDQLFYVVEGEGWVAGDDGSRAPIRAGQAALWSSGEEHESGSRGGMTAVVIEATRCALR